MKVLLVQPRPKYYYKATTSPLGLLSIATYLKEKKHTVKIVDRIVNSADYVKTLNEFNPDIVGVSVISQKSISDALHVSLEAQQRKTPVVWGGALASVVPEVVLKHDSINYVIISEGEKTWNELLDSLENKTALDTIDGLAYMEDGVVHINKERAFADLVNFPPIDWSLVDPTAYLQSYFSTNRMINLYSSKGCPWQCAFCFNNGSINRCEYRKRPFQSYLEEIRYLVDTVEIDGVHFVDELWCRNNKEMVEKCDLLINSGIKILWGCSARIETFCKEDYEYLFRAGCRWIFFGIESGSKRMQREINKNIPLDIVTESISNCVASGITAITSFIIGFPGETIEDVKQTVDLAKKISMAMYDFSLYFPVPGSDLCKKLVAEGKYTLPNNLEECGKILPTDRLVENFSNIPTRDLKVIRAFFMWSSFTRKGNFSGTEASSFTKKAVKDAIKGMFGLGVKSFLVSFYVNVKTFLDIFFSLVLHPKIRRKYGLKKTKE